MDYLQRLLLRALAVPRGHAASVFDPFEQTAPWVLDTPVPVVPLKAAAEEGAPVRPVPPAPAVPSPTALPASLEAPAASPHVDAPAAHVAPRPPPSVPTPARHGGIPALIAQLMPAPAEPSTLARADAFMQALGIGAPAVQAPAVATPLQPTPPSPAPMHDDHHVKPKPEEQAPAVLVRPTPPRVLDLPAPPSPRARDPERTRPATPAALPAAAPAAKPAPAPAERFVQTTVVVSPPSRRLDDLAHSSGIVRFGIGQG